MSSSETDFFAAARHVLWVIETADNPTEAMLLEALDRLAVAYYDVPEVVPPKDVGAPPRFDEDARRRAAAARFPQLGFYWQVASQITQDQPEILTGDAIDDIVDIAAEMHCNLWLLDNVGKQAALWNVHLLRMHWAWHMRDLAMHLEERRREA